VSLPKAPVPAGPLPQPPATARAPFRRRHVIWALVLVVALLGVWALMPAQTRYLLVTSLRTQSRAVGLVLGFGALSLSLLWAAGEKVDAWTFLLFNLRGRRPLWLDWGMLGLTQLGNGLMPFILVGVAYSNGDRQLALEAALGTMTLWLVVEGVKAAVGRARPFVRLAAARIVGFREPGRSFPSGHTSQSFFLAALLINHYQLAGWAALGLYVLALLIGLTRMYVGAHYPRDVLAGAILGSLWGLLGVLVDQRFFPRL
jgi:membrane-associated phospholipid phosphatase